MGAKNWDIFCKVVDNFGDIGFCWRLARQLVAEHAIRVRLWVDDLDTFRRLCPTIDPARDSQKRHGVLIRRWSTPFPRAKVADVVIEAFACELPQSYLAAVAARRPAWINLEYLSAEDWVPGCHGLPSPHPQLPLTRHFFFPGFVAGTGGLLREAGLIARRDRADSRRLWAGLGLSPPQDDEVAVSLFCYDNPGLSELFDIWAGNHERVHCLVPEGQAWRRIAAWFGRGTLAPGHAVSRGALVVHPLPFMAQARYDELLWACDLNFVRGEDSFVRALWAARPLVWQPYPQDDEAHRLKLDAFLDRYCTALSQAAAAACRALWHAWSEGSGTAHAWPPYRQARAELEAHAKRFADDLAKMPDLANRLVRFCENLVK